MSTAPARCPYKQHSTTSLVVQFRQENFFWPKLRPKLGTRTNTAYGTSYCGIRCGAKVAGLNSMQTRIYATMRPSTAFHASSKENDSTKRKRKMTSHHQWPQANTARQHRTRWPQRHHACKKNDEMQMHPTQLRHMSHRNL